MTFELQPGEKSPRTYQCLDCDRPDPLKSDPLRRVDHKSEETDDGARQLAQGRRQAHRLAVGGRTRVEHSQRHVTPRFWW